MNIEYHRWWSPHLGHDMELKIYGHDGKAVLVFPSAGGKFYEYEDFDMVEACRPFIETGKIVHCLQELFIGLEFVRAPGHEAKTPRCEFARKRLGVPQELLLVVPEARRERFPQRHGLRRDHVHQRPALHAGEDLRVDLRAVLRARQYDPAPRAAHGLVRGRGDDVADRHRVRVELRRDGPGDVRDVRHEHRAGLPGDPAELVEVYRARVG